MYFDGQGNRIRLDTRHLVWCAENKSDVLMRIQEKEERERRANRAFNLLRMAVSVPVGIFVFQHIRLLYLHPLEVIEGVGVVAGLAFIASTIRDLWEVKE